MTASSYSSVRNFSPNTVITNRRQALATRISKSPIRLGGVGSVGQALAVAEYGWDGLFLSGLAHTYEHFGLADEGFLTHEMQLGLLSRIRQRLPDTHIVVDIDTGLAGPIASVCEIVRRLEAAGASAVVLEDQDLSKKRCGHLAGKELMPSDAYVKKLEAVMGTVQQMAVVARTDASDRFDILQRVREYAQCAPDFLLIDGITDTSLISALYSDCKIPFAFNQMHKGKSPRLDVNELYGLGVRLVIYSAPCTFASIRAIYDELQAIDQCGGALPENPTFGLADLTRILDNTNEKPLHLRELRLA